MHGISNSSRNLVSSKRPRSPRRDVLLIETPLEGRLVRAERRRSFLPRYQPWSRTFRLVRQSTTSQ